MSAASPKQLREQQALGERQQTALNRALAEATRLEAERDALRVTVDAQAEELARAREALALLTPDRAHLAAQLDAQHLLLPDYRTRVGLKGPAEILRRVTL
jgi:hypothetical protein